MDSEMENVEEAVLDVQGFLKTSKSQLEELTSMGQSLKNRLDYAREQNALDLKKVDEHQLKLVGYSAPSNRVQIIVGKEIHGFELALKLTLDEMKKYNEISKLHMQKEKAKCQASLYEILKQDTVELKPYHEVESITADLQQKSDKALIERKRLQQRFVEVNARYKSEFGDAIAATNHLKTIEAELILWFSNMRSKISDIVCTLNWESGGNNVELDNSAVDKLAKDITELESRLAAFSI